MDQRPLRGHANENSLRARNAAGESNGQGRIIDLQDGSSAGSPDVPQNGACTNDALKSTSHQTPMLHYYSGSGASGNYPAHQDYTSNTQYNTTTTSGEYFLPNDRYHSNEVKHGTAQGHNHDANSRSQQSNWLDTAGGPAVFIDTRSSEYLSIYDNVAEQLRSTS
ncbi:hypothetical protein DL98DRAFT_536462 [Cadophora sp. DSE1049]|nr:hypothetical protein DL98DRAFT_536462 [Cadophora sp. DSE1049]